LGFIVNLGAIPLPAPVIRNRWTCGRAALLAALFGLGAVAGALPPPRGSQGQSAIVVMASLILHPATFLADGCAPPIWARRLSAPAVLTAAMAPA